MSCFKEFRKIDGEYEYGMVFVENGSGTLVKSEERLLPCGFVIAEGMGAAVSGYEEQYGVPIAIAGRVLVSVDNREDLKVGDKLCTGENGKASKMTEEEYLADPAKILGIVTEIPTYEKWKTTTLDENERTYEISIGERVWMLIK